MATADPETCKFTCISCRVVFRDAEAQRGHYKSDWHRYNLKRKVAEMPPVSVENFQERVLSHRALAEAESRTGKRHNHCELCRKHFSTDNAYQSHLRSRKHKEVTEERSRRASSSEQLEREAELSMNLSNTENIMEHSRGTTLASNKEAEVLPLPHPSTEGTGPTTPTTVSDGEWEDHDPQPLDVTACLFCRHRSADLEANLQHMSLAHSFFLPDAEYVADLKGLLRYLGEKVGVGFVCVHCNTRGKTFHSLEAVQKHMVDKGHTQLLFEGDAALEYADYYDYSSSYPDRKEAEEGMDLDVDVPDTSLSVNSNLELVLPSGATVGHRSFQRYYRQNLTPSHTHSLVPRRADMGRVLTGYLAIGYQGPSEREVEGTRARWEAFHKRAQKKWELQIGVKGNKLQHHLKQQVLF